MGDDFFNEVDESEEKAEEAGDALEENYNDSLKHLGYDGDPN